MKSMQLGDGRRLKEKTKLIGMKWMKESPMMNKHRKRDCMKLREPKICRANSNID